MISDPTNYNNRTFHQSNASSSIAYPNVASYTSELLTQTYYDNYSWTGTASMSASIDQSNTSNTTYFYAPSNTSSPYAQSIVQTSLTRGVITGSKTEVLGSSGSQYLYTVNFYDSKGRNIQTQGKNLTGGLDVVTTQYSWGGAALRTLEQHSKSGANSQSHVVLTKMSYDHAGRTLNVTKTIYSTIGANVFNSGERQVYTNTYDELGQVKTKSLGYSQVTNAALDVLTYDYNIRGWLTGINKNYTLSGSNSNSFGMELAYDKTTSTNGTTSFAASQYGGNITGVIWKSKGDGVARKYDYTYDNTDQLTSAAFSQNTSGSTWDNTYLDFSVKSIVYDLNGNIQSLKQNGFILGNVNSTLDDLTYNYLNSGASNKLKNVLDNANAAGTKLGDFHYAGTKTTTAVDYNYDNNGNLTADANKTITTLAYNVLNLPSVITLPNGTITYTYDAAGNKLRKTVQENNASVAYQGTSYITNITSTTTYIGGFVYYSKSYSNPSLASLNASEALQFVTHEAGRARPGYVGFRFAGLCL